MTLRKRGNLARVCFYFPADIALHASCYLPDRSLFDACHGSTMEIDCAAKIVGGKET
jgi:hypothetical protein